MLPRSTTEQVLQWRPGLTEREQHDYLMSFIEQAAGIRFFFFFLMSGRHTQSNELIH